jgi:sec-independent protein translocase protein TatB
MFGMGWQEILLILVIAVLVIGPDQLPQVARTVGKLIAQFRRISNDLRDSLNKEFADRDDFKEFKEFQQTIDGEFRSVTRTAQNYVEKEVALEEAELRKIETEVKAATDKATLGDAPGEPQSKWVQSAGDFPIEAETPAVAEATPPGETAAPGANGSGEAAGANGAATEPAKRPRKETA